MDKPSDARGAEGLRITTPRPDTVDILVATVCALLETIGELTGRDTEAEALVKVVRSEFGG